MSKIDFRMTRYRFEKICHDGDLTDLEKQVLSRRRRGHTNADIAAELGYSESRIKQIASSLKRVL